MFLHTTFGLWFPLQTDSQLHFSLIIHDLPDSFIVNSITISFAFYTLIVSFYYIRSVSLDNLIYWVAIDISQLLKSIIVTMWLFIHISMPLQHTFSITFHHRLCTGITRWRGLLDRLYSAASQLQVHHPCVAADCTFTYSLRCRITVANRFPASFPTDNPWSTWWFHHGRHLYHYAFITWYNSLFYLSARWE